MKLTYTGGPPGFAMLVRSLRERGLDASYDPPIENRGAGDVTFQVAIFVAGSAASGLIGDAARAALNEVVTKVRARRPDVAIDVEDDDD